MFHRTNDNGTSITTQSNEAPYEVTNKEWINGFECFGFASRDDDGAYTRPLVAVTFETHNHETGAKTSSRVHLTEENIRAIGAALVDARVEVGLMANKAD